MADPEESQLPHERLKRSSSSPEITPNFTPSVSSAEDPVREKLNISKNERLLPPSTPWTSQPQSLSHRIPTQWWWETTVDIIMVLLPMPFYILLITVISVNGRGTEDHDLAKIEQAVKGAATVFPIIFAAVTGRAAVKYATWMLERGTSLGQLEQLMGSRTVASAFMTPLQLRSFNFITIGLVALWSMSPLGSQSVLHIFSAPIVPILSTGPVSYFNLRQQSYGDPSGNFERIWFNGYSMLFGASLLAPTAVKAGAMDLWGNPRIPYMSSIASSGTTPDDDGWLLVPQENFTPSYSSLFGLPLQGMPLGNTTVNVETSYIELACGNLTTVPQLNSTGGLRFTDLISPNGPFLSQNEVNINVVWAVGYKGPDVNSAYDNLTTPFISPTQCPDCLPGNTTSLSFEAGNLVYQEYLAFANSTSVFCTPSQIYVESTILCQKSTNDQLCQVIAQRPSRLPHPPPEITYLSFPKIALGLTNSLYNSTPIYDISISNPIQGFLYNSSSDAAIFLEPSSLALDDPDGTYVSPLYNISMLDFGASFGQLINAWIQGSFYNSTLITTGSPFSSLLQLAVTGNAPSFVPTSEEDLSALIQNQTAAFTVLANSTSNMQLYACDFAWTGVFFFATTSMLFAAILGVVFNRITVVPDYLGYVSSLAKESQYMRIPDGGANLDGMERAKLIKELRVRLGNVDEGSGDVGRLAFGRVEDTKPVSRNRFYI